MTKQFDLNQLSLAYKTVPFQTIQFSINTQQYKVRIMGKVEQSRERSSALPYISV